MDYPYIELDLSNGTVVLSLVVADQDRRHLLTTEPGQLQEVITTAKSLLPNISGESEDYADERGFEFSSAVDPTELDLSHIVEQLKSRLENPQILGLDAVDPGTELHKILISNWEADLYLAFKRAIHVDILKSMLEYAKRSKTIENFVLVPDETHDEFVQWMATDLETLGYDLKVKID